MSNNNFTVEKSFSAGVGTLYKAWTEEAALKEWWQPAGRKLKSVESELKEGGTIKYSFEEGEGDDGELFIDGTYETVSPNEQLVYSWNWKLENMPVENGSYKLRVNFSEDEDGSKLTVTQELHSEHEGIHPHEEGWNEALKNLESYLNNA
jgi:uncharacterized protein YndB with AHSA1/START domain